MYRIGAAGSDADCEVHGQAIKGFPLDAQASRTPAIRICCCSPRPVACALRVASPLFDHPTSSSYVVLGAGPLARATIHALANNDVADARHLPVDPGPKSLGSRTIECCTAACHWRQPSAARSTARATSARRPDPGAASARAALLETGRGRATATVVGVAGQPCGCRLVGHTSALRIHPPEARFKKSSTAPRAS